MQGMSIAIIHESYVQSLTVGCIGFGTHSSSLIC